MQTKLYSNAWHLLTGEQIIQMFDTLPKVSIQPNMLIVEQLKGLEVATLELIEDRSFSTVYRISETEVIYQIEKETGETFEFDDYESYSHAKQFDNLLKRYIAKEPVHRIETINGTIYLTRLKYPQFEAKYTPTDKYNQLKITRWLDKEPSPMQQINLLRKAGAYIKHNLK